MKPLLVFAVLATLGSTALASETVEWPDLIEPSVQVFDDPYRDLSYPEIEALKTIASVRQALARGGLSDHQQSEFEEIARHANLRFLESGKNADWLIEQRWVVAERRQKAATTGNHEVDGQVVSLSGYAIPAPPDPDGTSVAYLVPERGMCSHMPPPNANQMIKVRLTNAWQPRAVHEPVRLTGKLSISPTKEVVRIVDGPVQMNATFLMEVEHAETLADVKAKAGKSPDINAANALAQKLRASSAFSSTPQSVKP